MAYRHPSVDEKEAYVQALFDQIAEQYDRINQVMSAGQWRRWHRVFAQHTGLRPGMRSLDVACGTGDLAMLTAAQVGPTGRVVGVDFAEQMLAVGRRRVAASPFAGLIDLRSGNAMALDLPDGSFDCATIGWALRNVKDIGQVLREMHRVLKPGGRAVALEAARPANPLVRAGFFLYWKAGIPLIDWLVLRARRQAVVRPYTYLSRSLDTFPSPVALAGLFQAAGFRDTGYVPLNLGTVCIHFGAKV